MSKISKKRMEKKKKREREVYKKTLARRERIRKESAEDEKLKRLERETEPKLVPYRKAVRSDARSPEEIEARIVENLKELQKLEEQYEQEVAEREGLNEALEAEGFTTVQEKLNFLNEQAQEKAKEALEKKRKRRKPKQECACGGPENCKRDNDGDGDCPMCTTDVKSEVKDGLAEI
jgi:hypothetical protein